MHFLFNGFFALLLRPFLVRALCSIFYSSFAFQMEMTEFSDDWRFEFQKMHRCLLTDSTLRKSGLSECIWVGSIKPNGNSNGKATVTTNKRKQSFWGLQTLYLQKSRICSSQHSGSKSMKKSHFTIMLGKQYFKTFKSEYGIYETFLWFFKQYVSSS